MSTITHPSIQIDARPHVQHHLRIGRRSWPVILPKIRDPRIQLSFVIISVLTLGIGWLNFELSIVQVLIAAFTCAFIEVTYTLIKTSMIVWPASALQTASSTALVLRVAGTNSHDYWSFHGWYYYSAIGALGLFTKYLIRYKQEHLFNPSNIALVIAFLVLGSNRVEPLNFWWAPMSLPMFGVYLIILTGGFYIGRRLHLIETAISFWVTLSIGVATMALFGHSMTVRWSFSSIYGAHFWWTILMSPEILIFLFFMITDPKTAPKGRVARIAFGITVGITGSLLIAPWKTEFGAKVGLLSALLSVCALRPYFDRIFPNAGSVEDSPREFARIILQNHPLLRHRKQGAILFATLLLSLATFIGSILLLNVHAQSTNKNGDIGSTTEAEVAIDPSSLPMVNIDPNIAGISARLATQQGAQQLAAELLWNLRIETQALITLDKSILPIIDHGDRLSFLENLIDSSQKNPTHEVSTYTFSSMALKVVFPGGAQNGANAGFQSNGNVTVTTYSIAGERIKAVIKPFSLTFSMRQVNSEKWLITNATEE